MRKVADPAPTDCNLLDLGNTWRNVHVNADLVAVAGSVVAMQSGPELHAYDAEQDAPLGLSPDLVVSEFVLGGYMPGKLQVIAYRADDDNSGNADKMHAYDLTNQIDFATGIRSLPCTFPACDPSDPRMPVVGMENPLVVPSRSVAVVVR